jgi:hypothetical protein
MPTLARRPAALAALLVGATLPLGAQSAERYALSQDATVYDPAGRVQVVAGDGADVEVEVRRGGRDAGRLRIARLDGGRALAVVAPERELVYPGLGHWSSTTFRVRDDGSFGDGDGDDGWRDRGRELRVASRGDGPEAWADLVVRVPRGRRVTVRLGAGVTTASNVDGDLRLSTNAGDVTTDRTRGRLHVGTGSGRVRVRDAEGDEVRVGTGSGSVEVHRVRAGRINVGSGSGTVEAEDVSGQEVRLGTGSGGVRVGRLRARTLNAGSGSGRLDLELGDGLEEARLSTGSGGVTVRVPASFGATFDVTTGSGGISTGLPVQVARQERHRFNGSIGDGRARVRVSAGSGEVRIEPAR